MRPNSEWSDDQPFTHVARNLGTDFGHLANPVNAAVIGAGVLGAIAMHRHDVPLSNWAAAQPASSYTKIGSVTGDAITQASIAIGTYAIGKIAHGDEATHLGSDLIRAQLLNGIFTEALNTASIARGRPVRIIRSRPGMPPRHSPPRRCCRIIWAGASDRRRMRPRGSSAGRAFATISTG